jgi:predicted nucleic acid-binding protein
MICAVDTNVLLRSIDRSSPQHAHASQLLQRLQFQRTEIAIFPQIVYEFWNTATRPASSNGLGYSALVAQIQVERIYSYATIYHDKPDLLDRWQLLVFKMPCLGRLSMDARIVAAMQTHGIETIATFNVRDFERFSQLKVRDPNRPTI